MNRRDGFTLIEILAVIAILGLLMGLAAGMYAKFSKKGEVTATIARITELTTRIQKYAGAGNHGGPPVDRLQKLSIQSNNDINEGAEALYASLQNKDFPEAAAFQEDILGNTDEDTTATAFHRIPGFTPQLFEVCDYWGNPIAYFHYSDYMRQQTYRMAHSNNPENPDQIVAARQSKKTGTWLNPDSYQLISAGPDEEFGTDDDITNE